MDSSKEFLNPSSMLTPGLAGGMTMGITNSLAVQFALLPPGPAYVGLGLSFLFGLLVWANQDVSRLKRCVLYVLNSLVIFVVAVGSNTMGGAVSGPAVASAAAASLSDVLMSSAVAQTQPEVGWCCIDNKLGPATQAECSKASGRFTLKEDAARASCGQPQAGQQQQQQQQQQQPSNKFFRPWVGQKQA
jgi:hypothetical protein